MKNRLQQAMRKLGPQLQEAVRRLNMGESQTKVGKALGINQRWLSDLKPLLKGNIPPADAEGVLEPEPEGELEEGVDEIVRPLPTDRQTMATIRRLAGQYMPVHERIQRLTRLAKSNNPSVA